MGMSYRVRLIKLLSGERFPFFLDGTGESLFQPSSYALTKIASDDKRTTFVQEIALTLEAAHFSVFRPLFDFIKSKRTVAG